MALQAIRHNWFTLKGYEKFYSPASTVPLYSSHVRVVVLPLVVLVTFHIVPFCAV